MEKGQGLFNQLNERERKGPHVNHWVAALDNFPLSWDLKILTSQSETVFEYEV